jgi:hypothetical protein
VAQNAKESMGISRIDSIPDISEEEIKEMKRKIK